MIRKILSLMLAAVLMTGCAAQGSTTEQKRYQASFLTLFDTVTSIVGYAESEEEFEKITDEIHDQLEAYHQLFDIYNEYEGMNNLKTINDNAGRAPVEVDPRIIELLLSMADDINNDPVCKGKLQVFFLENYRVSAAERLMPAAQISEQISTAGKEASGTGNMKLMMNGALTIGTLDGANVEMYERLGDDNMFLFGLKTPEVEALRGHYNPLDYYNRSSRLKSVIHHMNVGFSDGKSYSDLANALLYGGDQYMLMADFDNYIDVADNMYDVMADTTLRAKKSLMNIAESGIFAADRSIRDYNDRIWHAKSVK